MPVEFKRIEHNPPGGTLAWMAYMFTQSLKATLKGVISAFLMSFPALIVAMFVPGGIIAYAVFVVTIGISTGGLFKDFRINMDGSKRGFTLIELLVVIAIIGILSSIVLVALNGVRDKARDARIIADMSQLRSVAEMLYDGDYDAFTKSDSDVSSLDSDITDQGGSLNIQTELGEANYCAHSGLNRGGYYCISSDGTAEETSTNPGGVGYCDGTTFDCP